MTPQQLRETIKAKVPGLLWHRQIEKGHIKTLIMPCWRKSMWQPDQTHAT